MCIAGAGKQKKKNGIKQLSTLKSAPLILFAAVWAADSWFTSFQGRPLFFLSILEHLKEKPWNSTSTHNKLRQQKTKITVRKTRYRKTKKKKKKHNEDVFVKERKGKRVV